MNKDYKYEPVLTEVLDEDLANTDDNENEYESLNPISALFLSMLIHRLGAVYGAAVLHDPRSIADVSSQLEMNWEELEDTRKGYDEWPFYDRIQSAINNFIKSPKDRVKYISKFVKTIDKDIHPWIIEALEKYLSVAEQASI